MAPRTLWLAVLAGLASSAAADGPRRRTSITIWAAPSPAAALYGGQGYGGYAPTTGAMITDRRDVEVSRGEVRVPGVAATLDPASVQLRDQTDPTSAITQQRFEAGSTSPTQLLQRHVGSRITVVTPRGEVVGVLRSADPQTLVVETGTGPQRRLQVLRRDGYVQDVRLPVGAGMDQPSLIWRVTTKRPGKHALELSYRADGLAWNADYLAVLDEQAQTVDFSAWATIRNATGASFDQAKVTLISGGNAGPLAPSPYGGVPVRAAASSPTSYVVATATDLPAGKSVQVELLPTVRRAKARPVVTFEAMADPSMGFQAYPNTDCSQFNGVGAGTGRSERSVEVDLPTRGVLPDGRVRAFRRTADRLEIVSEDQLRSSIGVARIRLTAEPRIVGERRAVTCNYDERARTVNEKIEVRVENKSRSTAEIVIREFAWRWPFWRLDHEDAKSVRAAPQTLEYRAKVPAGGKRTVTYTVTYAW